MIEDITIDRMANAICQDTTFSGTYILVEGNNDLILFRKFFKNDISEIQIAFGKHNILEILDILKTRGFNNSIGILDADFNHLNKIENKIHNAFYTDNHDLETLIFESEALNVLFDQYCIEDKKEKFLAEHNISDLRKIFLNLIAPLGYLKWANQQNEWGLLFKPKREDGSYLKIEDFIPVTTIKFTDYETMVKTVYNYSRGKVKELPKEKSTLDIVKKMSKIEVDQYQLCNGHDLSYLFALALRRKISNLNAKAISAEQIERDLIMAYDSRYFERTKLYADIKNWEQIENKSILKF